ncbi:HEAT repeat domain-containing protein, partial [Limnospira sp. Paracas R14]|uniref:HEAT repeat domain-containing protein n=1 Tax=Limnospira sp. Paracas R14 TaxID=2981108 RepID=UPI0028E171E9|nr:HEAT repeat domain-containing protein [Limnospira sp. Paracas R14]
MGRDGRGDSIFAFYHATFQEYFAALAVEDWDYFLPRNHVDSPVAGRRYRIFEKQWKQVILCWLGRKDIQAQKKEDLIRALVEFEDGVRDFYEYKTYLLAAAEINQFKACSLATDIVRQVVKWGFGYLNTEKQEWQTFLEPIEEAAREVIPQTIRPLAMSALIELIENCPEKDSRMQAAESLGKIDPGNPDAIAVLVEIIRTTEDKYTRYQAAESLGKIGQVNPDAIAVLVEIIRTTEDKYTRYQAAESLGKIGQVNPDAIAVLVEIIRTTEDKYTRYQAAESLGKIGQVNPDAIAVLVEIIRTTEDK